MGRRILPPGLRGQPVGAASFDRQNALGRCLDSAWTGDNLAGKSVGGGLIVAPTAGSALKATARGLAIANTGTVGTMVSIPAITAFPYVQVGMGYFAGSATTYILSLLDATAGGYASRIALASSTSIALTLRYNFGTTRTLTVTTGSGTNAGLLICAIAVVYSSTDYRLFVNGQQVNGTLSPGTLGSLNRVMPPGGTLNGGLYFSGFGSGRSISDADALRITANPALLWDALANADAEIIWAPSSAGGSAALAGDAHAIASASGALSVAVPIVGAAVNVATASGALSTSVPLSGAAAAIAVAHGALTLGVVISGAAIANATATGQIQTAVPLSGAATVQASASGQMQIAVALSGAAIVQATASGALGVSGGSSLSGDAHAIASAAGALSVAVPLQGNASILASASGSISKGQNLAGAAVGVVTAQGNLLVSLNLSGAAIANVIATGQLVVSAPLSGAAIMRAIATGSLSISGDGSLFSQWRTSSVAAEQRRTPAIEAEHRAIVVSSEGRYNAAMV